MLNIGRWSCEIIIKKRNTLVTQSCVLDAWFRDLKIWGLEIKFVENYFFLEIYITSEGAGSHNVLYYQPLPILVTKKGFMLIIIFCD